MRIRTNHYLIPLVSPHSFLLSSGNCIACAQAPLEAKARHYWDLLYSGTLVRLRVRLRVPPRDFRLIALPLVWLSQTGPHR
ncbi:unnamed protein product [Protopolystoma xenopodis]|uniref:Uncharacterized protein n=1 Tax=Protopolystoma xenopodis TaxID=117903 RepID=A0A448XEZ5_9PLAT|nr:unnamed protein product [Protopolystoma xenopodis]